MEHSRPFRFAAACVALAIALLVTVGCDGEDAPDALTWTQLRNATYPSTLQQGTDITLVDGAARVPTEDGGTRLTARLADIGAFGEIDSGESTDSAVFLAERADDGALITSLIVVLNEDGEPAVQQPFPLGQNVAVVGVTVSDRKITTRVRALGSYDATSGTIDEIVRISTFGREGLQIEDESTEKVALPPPADFAYEPQVLDAQSGEATIDFTLPPRRTNAFILQASAGQQLEMATESLHDSAVLSMQGLSDDITVVNRSAYSTSISVPVPATQSYSVRVWSVAGDDLDVQLSYELTGDAEPVPDPTAAPEPTLPTTELAAAVPESSVTDLGPERSLGALSQQAVDYITTRAPARGIAVITADQGVVYAENGDQQLETASVIKVVVMACTMLRAEQQGRPVDEWELSLMWPMITYSDNDATDVLWYDLGGGPGIAACLESIGASGITPYMGDYWGTSTASALGIVTLMGRIAFGSVVNDVHRAVALEMLTNVIPEQRWGIPAGADGSGQEIVGVKDGWYPDDDGWRVNSVGFISPIVAGAPPYAIAVMTNNQTTQEYGIATIEGLALPVLEALRSEP